MMTSSGSSTWMVRTSGLGPGWEATETDVLMRSAGAESPPCSAVRGVSQPAAGSSMFRHRRPPIQTQTQLGAC
jgi:hypothetical protein